MPYNMLRLKVVVIVTNVAQHFCQTNFFFQKLNNLARDGTIR